MKALISGQAGIAVLIDGNEYTSIEVHSTESVRRAEHDVPYLVGDASDLIELDETSRDDAARELEVAWLKDRSIHLALIALDREAASSSRQSAVECLSDLLKELPVADFVRNRLYAAPLPPSADLSRTLDLAESCGSTKFASILKEVRTAQEPIRRNRLAWDALRPDLFGGIAEKERFGFAAVESGMFRLLTQGQCDDALRAFDKFTRDPQTGAKWDARRLVKRWRKINALAATEWPASRPTRLAHGGPRPRRFPMAVARTARAAGAFIPRHRALAAVACVVLAIIGVFSIYLTPVSAKNATALTPPGTGGIKASASLLRSELRFANGGATARRQFEEAEDAFSAGEFAKAARLYGLSGEAVDTLAAKLNFGIAVYNSSDLPKAAAILSSGVQIARQKHLAFLEAAFLTNLGNVRRDQGHLDEAARLYIDAGRVDQSTDTLGSATNAYNYGMLCVMRGSLSEALSQFDIALRSYRRLGNKLGEADTLFRRALVRRAVALDNAIEAERDESDELRTAAQLYQLMPGPLAEASYHFAVGNGAFLDGSSHRNQASGGNAVSEFNVAYGIYKSIGFRQGQTVVKCATGSAYTEQSNSREATIAYGECLSIATEIGNPFMQSIALASLGQQQVISGETSNGLEHLEQALHIAQEIGCIGIEVNVLEEIGNEYVRRGDLTRVKDYRERAVKTAEGSGDPYLLIHALRAAGSSGWGDPAGAAEVLVRLRDLYAMVGNLRMSGEVQGEIDRMKR
jgi:tetratricopeptide (TPR) repeat protein